MNACAFILYYDLTLNLVMLARTTHQHPDPRMWHMLKAVGGKCEVGETPLETVLREAQEEQPGWVDTYVSSKTEPEFVCTEVDSDGWEISVFIQPATLTERSFYSAIRSATESVPEFFHMDVGVPMDQVAPWLRSAFDKALAAIESK